MDTDTSIESDTGVDAESDTGFSDTPLYVDVRTPEEFAEGHCVDAVNIPVTELKARVDELGESDRWIVVYCRSVNRSNEAKTILDKAGFTHVDDGGAFNSLSCEKI